MLVLSRKAKERIKIGPDIFVSIERIGCGSVKVGIEAPKGIEIIREELVKETGTHTPQDAGGGTEAQGE